MSVLVFVHELGHFMMARWVGVKVEEFGFGLPPRIWGKKVQGTIYSINWLPIGGFVKLAGEDESEGEKVKGKGESVKEYFWARSKKERAAILLAGVAMNFLLAVIVTTYLLTAQGVYEQVKYIYVEEVTAHSPAAAAGIVQNDIIKSVTYLEKGVSQTKEVSTPKGLIDITQAHKGEQVTLTIDRKGRVFGVNLVPRKEYPKGEGPMGIAISNLMRKKYPITQAPFEAVKVNLVRGWEMLASIGGVLGKLLQLKSPGADVAGPIGIAQVTGQAVKFGWAAVLEFMSILSLNLAVLNILPIPALDGGRLLFVVIEKILGRKVRPAFEQSTHQIGMIILFILIILISINDVLRLAHGG
ncbi:hypothetical protein A2Z00_02735 [Candidatus Gottesmanbacteria bacterium RBG_13_45_10]|uniref:Peptidase M50 domain-containing protein n=1 Tax=Candidatus Gottesmanbacteria bacterium RBG_13_45_10 TaxID=1798370 RepID=A0A1F5ZHD5_9BACT|nr:MAG: hypothetical protein A2Z00_02735 [Candidatus Gottesmanbacteria bacterium RBG_13_45_10]